MRTGRDNDCAAQGLGAADNTPIAAIMTEIAVRLSPDDDASTAYAMLRDRGASAATVVDRSGRALGILCMSDLALAKGRKRRSVDELMTPFVFALPIEASVARAAALMAYERVNQLVVRDSAGTVAGLVCATDVAHWLARQLGYFAAQEMTTERARDDERSNLPTLDYEGPLAAGDGYGSRFPSHGW